MLIILISLFLVSINAQTSDLITQADGVFTKLNSNATADAVSKISDNIILTLEGINSYGTKELTHKIFNNMNEFFDKINSNDTEKIIRNLRILTENSKLYIDVDDKNWQVNRIMIYVEILLIIMIIMLSFLFVLCLFKIFKKRKEPTFDFYNPLQDGIINHQNNIN